MIEIPVASYNVHQCVGLDGLRQPGRIAKILSELACPIIGLQEVSFKINGHIDSCQLRYFEDATKMQPVEGATRIVGDSCYGNVLLTTFPVRSTKLIDLTVVGREPRGAIESVLQIHGTDVRVIVTHLGLRSSERRIQVQKLLGSVTDSLPTMILGDLNEWIPMSRTMRWMTNQFGKTNAPRTFPSLFPVLPLDRIWSSHGIFTSLSAYMTKLTRVASDHLPIRATLSL
jgi:endonuclease/exonuclease/phosphatase family metal-dependent hydrolase